MNYLTNYYKNLSEQLQERVNHLSSLLESVTVNTGPIDWNHEREVRHLRSITDMTSEIDQTLSADMQKIQRDIRAADFKEAGLVPPHEQATGRMRLGAWSPSSSDLEELEKMGVVDAKNYTVDEWGVLHRPGPLPSEAERRATAIKRQETAGIGGGLIGTNTPETKQFRSDALRAYYNSPRSAKYSGRPENLSIGARIFPDETGQQIIPPPQTPGTPPGSLRTPLKAAGKAALKSVPLIGTLASVAAIADRAQAGDYTGAALEAGSEIADWVPGIGTATSLGIQGYLAARDAGETDEKAPTDEKAKREVDAAIKAGSPSKVRVTGPKF
jgi:hypothetical protein